MEDEFAVAEVAAVAVEAPDPAEAAVAIAALALTLARTMRTHSPSQLTDQLSHSTRGPTDSMCANSAMTEHSPSAP